MKQPQLAWQLLAANNRARPSVRTGGMTRLAAGLAGTAVGALVTWMICGRASAPAAAPPAREAPAHERCVQLPWVAAAPAPPRDDPRIERLVADNVQQAALIANDPDGALPAPYPAALPALYRERAFRDTLEAALRDCTPDSKLDGISCDEPPCVAVIALRHATSVEDLPKPVDDCAAWRAAYGRESEGGYNVVDCGDGRQEQVLVIAPELATWDGWAQLDDATREHIAARQWPRVKDLLAAHHCASAQHRKPVE